MRAIKVECCSDKAGLVCKADGALPSIGSQFATQCPEYRSALRSFFVNLFSSILSLFLIFCVGNYLCHCRCESIPLRIIFHYFVLLTLLFPLSGVGSFEGVYICVGIIQSGWLQVYIHQPSPASLGLISPERIFKCEAF